MKFATQSQQPVYRQGADGFYSMTRSLPAATVVEFTKLITDAKSNRPVGVLPSGELMYTDAMVQILDDVEVKDSRIWDWLIVSGMAIAGFIYVNRNRKAK